MQMDISYFSCDAISNYFAIIKIEIYIYKDGFIY